MEQTRLERINELARKARTAELTAEEQAEQQALRQEYIAAYRQGLKKQLDSIVLVDGKGNQTKLKQKEQG